MPLNNPFTQPWIEKNVPRPPADHYRLYHLTTAEFGITDIVLGRLKIARFSDLNDPFELKVRYIKRYEHIIRGCLDEYNKEIGLLCFSADWINPVLWGHYADKHRGMCLGFDIPEKLVEMVDYMNERINVPQLTQPGYSSAVMLSDKYLMERLRRTKSDNWKYEEEYRVLVPLEENLKEGDPKEDRRGSLYFYPFGDDLRLMEVILGERCTLSLDAVQQLTRRLHPQAVAFRARTARQWFTIVAKDS